MCQPRGCWLNENPETTHLERAGGLSKAAFARERGFHVVRLAYWAKQVKSREATALVPVVFAAARSARLEVRAGHATIVIERGFDAELLRTVVDALGGPC